MIDHDCPKCSEPFDSKRDLERHYSRRHNRDLLRQECAHCSMEFYVDYAKRYCSRECYRENASKYVDTSNPNYKGGKTIGVCRLCETEFEYYPSQKKGLYCSVCVQDEIWQKPPQAVGAENPRWNGGKRSVECEICGTTVDRYPSNIGKVTVCGEACRATWLSDAFSGSGHPNWKGGGNGEYGTGWNSVRQQALERDDYKCVVCRKTREALGRNPDVHHIVPVRRFIDSEEYTREDAHFLDNVVSLCISCHRKADFGKISAKELRSIIGIEDTSADYKR